MSKKNKTIKILPNKTPRNDIIKSENVRRNSNKLYFPSQEKSKKKSYTPTINRQLVTLKSISKTRKSIKDCNNAAAFDLKEPLKISVPGVLYGRYCLNYNEPKAKKFLLKKLSENKHVNSSKIIPPRQVLANCWFNALFVSFFVSDKGRKFFHFFRQLMIESRQKDGKSIPINLADAFALLNFGIEAALTGNKYAYELNTNSVIKKIHDSLPNDFKESHHIRNIKQAGNPLLYYMSITEYLNNNDISIAYVKNAGVDWKTSMKKVLDTLEMPHVIVIEIYDDDSDKINDRQVTLNLPPYNYKLDSAVVRDTKGLHFCAMVTVEKKEMAYDGNSFHRIVPMNWKEKLNKKDYWEFKGTDNLKWSFKQSYQLLFYYRTK
jgi:hypothetical protein